MTPEQVQEAFEALYGLETLAMDGATLQEQTAVLGFVRTLRTVIRGAEA